MKKAIILTITLLIVFSSTAPAHAASGITWKTRKAGKGYITTFYDHGHAAGKIRTRKKLPVKILTEKKCTPGKINHRRGRYILVMRIKGKCTSNNGDGKTAGGYYIKYTGAKKGDKFTTYAVYEDSKYIDDISIRIDIRK